MKVLVAPNSFKESLNSIEVAHYISCTLRKSLKKFEVIEKPLADGGTGTCRIITEALDGQLVDCTVTGPMKEKITATYGIASRQRVAIIELATAAGLSLIPKRKRNPLQATTIGVGELISDALAKHYHKIILSVGDSATIDCGVGALSVFGIRWLDRKGAEIELNCKGLLDLHSIDTTKIIQHINTAKITIASDVRNVLTGKKGALVYARQKGARPGDIPLIGKALKKFKKVILKQYNIDLDKIPGSGAAGGIGGAFVALLNAQVISGFGLVKELTYFEDAIRSCDIVITGEGRIDKQSFSGKTLGRILELARQFNKPVILICGHIKADVRSLRNFNVIAKFSLAKSSKALDKTIKKTPKLLKQTAVMISKTLKENF